MEIIRHLKEILDMNEILSLRICGCSSLCYFLRAYGKAEVLLYDHVHAITSTALIDILGQTGQF